MTRATNRVLTPAELDRFGEELDALRRRVTADLARTLWELALPQRWFSGRDGAPLGVDLGDPLADGALRPALLSVGFPDGRVERYLIPLLDGKDACDDAGVLLDLLAAISDDADELAAPPAVSATATP